MAQSETGTTAALIRREALALFASQGYEGTALSQLAQRVGIQKPSLYNHIQSKEALFLELADSVEQSFFEVQAASLEASHGKPLQTRLLALVTALGGFIFVADRGTFYKRCLLFPPAPLAAVLHQRTAANEARIDADLAVLYAQGSDERLWRNLSERAFKDAFYCFMDGLFTERFVYARDEYERRLASVWPIFWAGLIG